VVEVVVVAVVVVAVLVVVFALPVAEVLEGKGTHLAHAGAGGGDMSAAQPPRHVDAEVCADARGRQVRGAGRLEVTVTIVDTNKFKALNCARASGSAAGCRVARTGLSIVTWSLGAVSERVASSASSPSLHPHSEQAPVERTNAS